MMKTACQPLLKGSSLNKSVLVGAPSDYSFLSRLQTAFYVKAARQYMGFISSRLGSTLFLQPYDFFDWVIASAITQKRP
jgi:hypothetical protein